MLRPVVIAVFAALALGACSDPYEDPIPPRDRLNYPIGLSVHPNGRYLYAVNSNFDTRYREEVGGTLSVIDLSTLELLPRSSPFIPSFGGFVRLNEDGSRAYVSTRHSNAVVAFDVSASGDAVFCRDGETTTSDPAACLIRRVPDAPGGAFLPSDPFAMAVTTVERTNDAGDTMLVDLVNVAHLRGESVTTIGFPQRSSTEGPVAFATTMKFASLISGGSALAQRPGTLDYYVGGRLSRDLAIFSPYLEPQTGAVQALLRRGNVTLGNIGDSVDTRGLAFDATGETLYVVTRAPDALHVVDLGPSDVETAGGTLRKVVASIPIARNPSGIVRHVTPTGRTLLYIPSFDEQLIQVVDPESQAVVDRLELGARPYDFVVDTATDRCRAGTSCRAYVSLFDDLPAGDGRCEDHRTEPCGAIGVIDLDPESPRYHQLIGKIF